MLERVVLSALVMGVLAFLVYDWMLDQGWTTEAARNGILLLMVLFENVQAFNSRSETLSVFRHNPLRNRLLLFGTIIAQLVHIAAMYTPALRDILGIAPVSLDQWVALLGLALILLAGMELDKALRRHARQ
jgi:magnesium-transporting ATPase (P-type)